MKIAVAYDNGNIFQHFGHSEQFKIYESEEGKILNSEVVSTQGSGHGALSEMLVSLGVNTLICGGIGGGAKNALAEKGIKLFAGVSGNADEAVNALLMGRLDFNADVQCTHHHEGHSCGNNSCGEDKHGCMGN